jgi:hypothetical protein
MRLHFFSRLSLLLVAGFLTVVSQVWSGSTLQWLFVAGGVAMILGAGIDARRPEGAALPLSGAIGILGVWSIVQAFIFSNGTLEWISFAVAIALAALTTLGLMLHEMTTERVVHELSVVTGERTTTPASPAAI